MKTSNKEKSIFKMAEEDPNFKALLNIEYTGSEPFDFYEVLKRLNNPEEKLNSHKEKEIKMKTFGVFHIFDVDGGFGDAIPQEELICTFNSVEEAWDFIKKYEKPHVYDCPYQCLECGQLELRELPTTYNEKDFWWLSNEYEECDEECDEEDEE